MPKAGALDVSHLKVTPEDMRMLFEINREDWKNENARNRQFFAQFKDRISPVLQREMSNLDNRLNEDYDSLRSRLQTDADDLR